MNNLLLEVNNFRAISHARIKIDGITVLSGVNSSGKSTLSKLLYYSVKLALEFEDKQYSQFYDQLGRVLRYLSKLMDDYNIQSARDLYMSWRIRNVEKGDFLVELNKFLSVLDSFEQLFLEREKKEKFPEQELQRIANILFYDRKSGSQSLKNNLQNVRELFIEIRERIEILKEETFDKIKKRDLFLFENEMMHYFETQSLPISLEEDIPIIDYADKRLNNIYSVEHVFYYDTPMILSLNKGFNRVANDFDNHHRDDLQKTIWESPSIMLGEEQKKINTLLSGIISGNISSEETELGKEFTYKRSTDGLTIDLRESATGIKSFAILQLLLSEGLLNEKTLLILDEPEVHLHPQWIVEYARIVVLLNNHLGVKFMIASHNPDMISALRYISEKEGTLQYMHFYLAEKEKKKEQFKFKDLKTDIEPIFASFNIALDRINQVELQSRKKSLQEK